jgi:hypothetical protein
VIADQPAGEADQDRREGREPRPLRHIPEGRGRGAATNVPGNPVADRPAADTGRAGMTARSGQMRQTTTAEVRLDHRKAAGSGATRPSVSPFGLSAGRLRSNIVAARLADADNCAQRLRIRGMSVTDAKKWTAAFCANIISLSFEPTSSLPKDQFVSAIQILTEY